jgi:class 3 adenylate cyclase
MFCDLVGSTALSTRHDPEDLRELIASGNSSWAAC